MGSFYAAKENAKIYLKVILKMVLFLIVMKMSLTSFDGLGLNWAEYISLNPHSSFCMQAL